MNHINFRYYYVAESLSERLRRNDPTLQDVSVRRLPLMSPISSAEIASIVQSLQHNKTVKSLDLSLPRDDEDSHSNNDDDTDVDYTAIEDNENRVPKQRGHGHEHLVQMLQTNSTMETLSVHHVATDASWIALCRGLAVNSSIRTVNLGGALLTSLTEDLSETACRAIANLLMHTKTLERLSLSYVSVQAAAMELLAAGVWQNTSLKEIRLQQIESDQLPLLLEALADTRAPLERLSISECELESNRNDSEHDDDNTQYQKSSVTHPLVMLGRNATQLAELRITENILDRTAFTALCEGLETNTSVRQLDLSGNDLLGSDCAQALSGLLARNRSLLVLNLEENILLDAGVAVLCEGLVQNTALQELNLKANHLTATACEALSHAITSSSHLRTLKLSENDIGDAGAEALANVVDEANLRRLDLDACMLSDDGIVSLCRGLQRSASVSSLRELNLDNNRFKERGVQAMSDVLATSSALETLDLSACHMTDNTIKALLESLTNGQNTTLRCLYLSFNSFGNSGAQHVARMLRSGNNRLATLSVQFNAFDSASLSCIIESLQHNVYLTELFFWNGSFLEEQDERQLQELEHWLALNKAGRCAVQEHPTDLQPWPRILERAGEEYGANALYYLLREKPELFLSGTGEAHGAE